jgi:hypothetical protein
MVSKRVTQDLLDKMVAARKKGATYQEIEAMFNVSRWTTLHYLKGIEQEVTVAEELWKQAEEKAELFLSKRGFTDIINLNLICPTGYFDILATKVNHKWLIDVTINESKDLASKSMRVIPNYRCGVLYISHNLETHRLVELKEVPI